MSSRLLIVGCAGTLLSLQAIYAQPAQEPSFEVVSIRENVSRSSSRGEFGAQPGGRWLMTNGTVKSLIVYAYSASTTPIIGPPAWIDSARYDVIARGASPNPPLSEMRAMVRRLLAERFGLIAHFEEREQSTYSLVLVNKDRLGRNLRRVDFDCDAMIEAVSAGKMQMRDVPKASNGVLGCTSALRTVTNKQGAVVTISQHGGTRMKAFAESMQATAGRPVLDKTGLEGFYEYSLEYSSDPLQSNASGAPSYFTALSEQLGLRITPDRGVARVLVIDTVSRPSTD